MAITAVQNSSGGGALTNTIAVGLPAATTAGNFLTACIGLGAGVTVASVSDTTAGYDGTVGSLNPLDWWKMNETSGTTTFDYGSANNNGAIENTVTLGLSGPIAANPSDTAYGFTAASVGNGMQGWGILGRSFLGADGTDIFSGEVLLPVGQWEFGVKSFSVAGWINGSPQSPSEGSGVPALEYRNSTTYRNSLNYRTTIGITGSPAYIFDNSGVGSSASVATGLEGDSLLGEGLLGGGLLTTSGAGFALYMTATGKLEFTVTDAFGNTESVESPDTYTNAWHFVVGVVDRSTNTMYLYVDGGFVGQTSVATVGAVSNAGTNATIGNGVKGDVSQVFIMNYALSSLQIQNIYNSSFSAPQTNYWIQAAYSNNGTQDSEIWYSRGIRGGQTVVTIALSGVTNQSGVNISEWSGVQYTNPLVQWSQNFGSTAIPIAQPVQPSADGNLMLAAAAAGSALISGPTNGYTALPMGSNSDFDAAQLIENIGATQYTSWNTGTSQPWVVCQCSFLPGVAGLNPQLQFPETLVEISLTTDFSKPVQGLGVWTNMSRYVRSFSTTGPGKNHLLDRIQASTATITVDNRTGAFNRWNTQAYFYESGVGLLPMNPIQIRAAWNGVTSHIFLGYLQSVTPQISDALNVDAVIDATDILGILSLSYLANSNYAQLLLSGN